MMKLGSITDSAVIARSDSDEAFVVREEFPSR